MDFLTDAVYYASYQTVGLATPVVAEIAVLTIENVDLEYRLQ